MQIVWLHCAAGGTSTRRPTFLPSDDHRVHTSLNKSLSLDHTFCSSVSFNIKRCILQWINLILFESTVCLLKSLVQFAHIWQTYELSKNPNGLIVSVVFLSHHQRISIHCCVLPLRWVDAQCCPFAGCPRRASCTGSSQRRATSGASAWSSGRSSPTANSRGISCPTVRWVGTER